MSGAPLPEPLSDLCHALSQPLTAARCSIELALQLPADDPRHTGLLEDAIAALERMSQITRQIRDWPGAPR